MGATTALPYNGAVTKGTSTLRKRYYVLVSVIYIGIGLVIMVRSVLAHVVVIGVLGLVFIALGAVRLRDYAAWTRKAPR